MPARNTVVDRAATVSCQRPRLCPAQTRLGFLARWAWIGAARVMFLASWPWAMRPHAEHVATQSRSIQPQAWQSTSSLISPSQSVVRDNITPLERSRELELHKTLPFEFAPCPSLDALGSLGAAINPLFRRINGLICRINPFIARVNPLICAISPFIARINPLTCGINPLICRTNPYIAAMNPLIVGSIR